MTGRLVYNTSRFVDRDRTIFVLEPLPTHTCIQAQTQTPEADLWSSKCPENAPAGFISINNSTLPEPKMTYPLQH